MIIKISHRLFLEKEDIDTILSNYEIGQFGYFKQIRSGHQSDNYLITTSNGKFVIKVFYESKVNPNSFLDVMRVSEYLALHKIKTTRPIRTKSGSLTLDYKRKTIGLQTFLEGKSHIAKPSNKLFGLYGSELGKADNVLRNLKLESIKKFEGGPVKFVSKIESKHRLTDPYLCSQFALLKKEFSEIPVKSLTKSIIHGDSGPGNFIVKDDKITGIIDFGAVRMDYMLSEVSFFLSRAHIYGIKDRLKYLAFIKEYVKASKIRKDEIRWLRTFVKAAIFCDLIFSYVANNKEKLTGYKKALKLLETKPDLYKEFLKQ